MKSVLATPADWRNEIRRELANVIIENLFDRYQLFHNGQELKINCVAGSCSLAESDDLRITRMRTVN